MKKKKLKINRMIIIIVLCYFAYVVFSQQKTLNAYEQESQLYQNEIVKAEQNADRLQDIRNNKNSTEYIEKIAREKLGMYLPNERVYIDATK